MSLSCPVTLLVPQHFAVNGLGLALQGKPPMDAIQNASNAISSLPGFGILSTVYENKAPDFIKTKDPFYVKVDGKVKRRQPPPGITERQRKAWKFINKKAWYHDKNFCGCAGFSLGLGIIPILNIFPVIGPIMAYSMHSTLAKRCADAGLPEKDQAKMVGNITLDFVISLVPILGVIFSWMNSCSVRNAALFDSWLQRQGKQRDAAAHQAREDAQLHAADLEARVQSASRQSQPPGNSEQRRISTHSHPSHNPAQVTRSDPAPQTYTEVPMFPNSIYQPQVISTRRSGSMQPTAHVTPVGPHQWPSQTQYPGPVHVHATPVDPNQQRSQTQYPDTPQPAARIARTKPLRQNPAVSPQHENMSWPPVAGSPAIIRAHSAGSSNVRRKPVPPPTPGSMRMPDAGFHIPH